MQRRLGKFFPIVLIAMLVQILAPISASWAFGAAVSDPLHLAGICSDVSNSVSPADDQGSSSQPAHNGCCTLCCVAQAVASSGDPQASIVKLERDSDAVIWRDLILVPSLSAAGSNAQARGPPGIS